MRATDHTRDSWTVSSCIPMWRWRVSGEMQTVGPTRLRLAGARSRACCVSVCACVRNTLGNSSLAFFQFAPIFLCFGHGQAVETDRLRTLVKQHAGQG